MTSDQAQSAVSISAFVVAAIWGYRKLVEKTTSSKTTAPTSHFVIGFGFAFIALSLLAQATPALGGMLAIGVATTDALVNGTQLTRDLQGALGDTASATGANQTSAAVGAASSPLAGPAGTNPLTA